MASGKYFMIYLEPKNVITYEQVEAKMNLANDWFRISSNLWIVYSTSAPSKWYERLETLVEENGRLFISELNIENSQGWMVKDFWDWIEKDS